jgi:hypothetical protein
VGTWCSHQLFVMSQTHFFTRNWKTSLWRTVKTTDSYAYIALCSSVRKRENSSSISCPNVCLCAWNIWTPNYFDCDEILHISSSSFIGVSFRVSRVTIKLSPFPRRCPSYICVRSLPANSVDHSRPWEAYSPSTGQEISRLLCNLKVHCPVHKNQSLDPILSLLNPTRTHKLIHFKQR